MIFSKKQITKALISLSGCAGWSAPMLFANPKRFSPIKAHIVSDSQKFECFINTQLQLPSKYLGMYLVGTDVEVQITNSLV